MLFNFVLYFAFLTFLNSSVTDEYFVDDMPVWRKYKIDDEFICNHWVDATAGEDLFPRGYHQPSSQHFCVDLSYHWYVHVYKLTVYKTFEFLKY